MLSPLVMKVGDLRVRLGQIGLLPGFGWVADQAWFGDSVWSHLISTLLVCWALTPAGHIVWAFVAQATVVPIDSKRQWRSFFPGDLFLGAAIALVIVSAGKMSSTRDGWWQSTSWHVVVLCAAILVATAMTVLVDRPVMPLSALLSPSKQYHNFLLYAGYGYVAVTSLVAAIAGNGWSPSSLLWVALAAVAVTPWVVFLIQDGQLSREEAVAKQRHAHPAEYKLFWIYPVRGSYEEP